MKNETIRPINYLGSKLRILGPIKDALDAVKINNNGYVCDLFSGSGTVSKYLNYYTNTLSVDIQHYSQVLCEANLTRCHTSININDLIKDIDLSTNAKQIKTVFSELCLYEKKCMEEAKNDVIDNLFEIVDKGSIYTFMHETVSQMSLGLSDILTTTITNLELYDLQNSPDTIITRYYGGLYFSYMQSVTMDCILSYIDKYQGIIHTKLLAAILSTASEIVNTVGKQFAQPLKVTDAENKYKKNLKNKVISDRELNVMDIFIRWANYYLNVGNDKYKHKIICGDYLEALDDIKHENISVIYADPPYTRYHYSRYYHVLETICLRDNPPVSTTFPNGKGGISRAIYREDRHQSPFCIKSKAFSAFDNLFKKCSELEVPLVLSYSPYDTTAKATPRLMTIDSLIALGKKYYSSIETVIPGEFTHSKLNLVSKNFDSNHEAEILIILKQGNV